MNKAPYFLFWTDKKKGWDLMNSKPVIEVKVKKENVFSKIKRWWKEELSEDERTWLKIVGIWTIDGAMLGTAITGAVKNKQIKKTAIRAAEMGYTQGQIDAYKEMAQNPYFMMDAGMRKLEQQGKAKRF